MQQVATTLSLNLEYLNLELEPIPHQLVADL